MSKPAKGMSVAEILVSENHTGVKINALRELAGKRGGYVLAVDFDGTLCTEEWPLIGEPRHNVIAKVKFARVFGIKVVLWTCREGKLLDEALAWCAERGLTFDAVNNNIEERNALYGNDPRKVGCDELWDDRARPI